LPLISLPHWPCWAMWKALERLSWQLPWKSASPAPCPAEVPAGGKRQTLLAHRRHVVGAGAGSSSLRGGPCQGTVPAAAAREERAAQLGCSQGSPPPFAIPCCPAAVGAEDRELAAAVPRLGRPNRQHSPILSPSSLLPGPGPSLPLSRQLSMASREGAQAAVPLPSRPLSSPQPGRTAPQPPEAGSLRAQGLGLPARVAKPPHAQGWAPMGLFSGKPLPASPCCCAPRCPCWPHLCQQPKLTLRAGAAHAVPTRLAVARPHCLPCWLLLSLARHGAFGGPSASGPRSLSPRHLWAKAGSLLRASPSAPAARPAQAEPAPAAAPRCSPAGARVPEATAARQLWAPSLRSTGLCVGRLWPHSGGSDITPGLPRECSCDPDPLPVLHVARNRGF